MNTFRIRGLDPIVFGDGRPFSADAGTTRVRSLTVPLPTTLAGALRTAYGLQKNLNFDTESDALFELGVRGPILARDGAPLFATPASLVPLQHAGRTALHALRPREFPTGVGCDMPAQLLPLRFAPEVERYFGEDGAYSPLKGSDYHFLTLAEIVDYLSTGAVSAPPRSGPVAESRIHVGIDYGRLSARRGLLYQTEGIRIGDGLDVPRDDTLDERENRRRAYDPATTRRRFVDELLVQFEAPLDAVPIRLGGEGRIARLCPERGDPFACPDGIRARLKGAQHVVMVLATPACFRDGWRPGWIGSNVPGANVKLDLKAAACPRKQPVSGWDLKVRGPKPVKWLAPAGSTYFFDVQGDASALADLWMMPVSDDPADRKNGLGCALWGIWNPEPES